MCNLTNDVPQAFDWDAAAQKSVNRWDRAELNHSVVEFVAPQEYMVRPPQPLVYLFLFDVSYAAVSSGLLATSARTILDSLNRIPNADRRTRIGFIAADSSLHYFAIPKDADENAETSMLVISDLTSLSCPFLMIFWCLLPKAATASRTSYPSSRRCSKTTKTTAHAWAQPCAQATSSSHHWVERWSC